MTYHHPRSNADKKPDDYVHGRLDQNWFTALFVRDKVSMMSINISKWWQICQQLISYFYSKAYSTRMFPSVSYILMNKIKNIQKLNIIISLFMNFTFVNPNLLHVIFFSYNGTMIKKNKIQTEFLEMRYFFFLSLNYLIWITNHKQNVLVYWYDLYTSSRFIYVKFTMYQMKNRCCVLFMKWYILKI